MNYEPLTINSKQLLVIVGPTACGKSKLALQLAKKIDAEIVSADSMQVYKGLDIGTAKPTLKERQKTAHHMIDIVDFKQPFSVAVYQKKARAAIEDIYKRQKTPILVGGTGLYVRAVIDDLKFPQGEFDSEIRNRLEEKFKKEGEQALFGELERLDPKAAKSIDSKNIRRVIRALEVIYQTGKPFSEYSKSWENFKSVYNTKIFGLKLPREELYERINKRVDLMIEGGLLEETKSLIEQSFSKTTIAKQAIGYKELIDYLDGKMSFKEAVDKIKQHSRNYAKRQMTWFRKDPRVEWIKISELGALLACARKK